MKLGLFTLHYISYLMIFFFLGFTEKEEKSIETQHCSKIVGNG